MAYITLPMVTVQRDFNDVIRYVADGVPPADKFWVSCYKASEPSVHATIDAELDMSLTFTARDGDVDFIQTPSGCSVACSSLTIPPTPVLLPVQDYNDSERTNPLRPQRITAFDVSPDASRFATGHLDGSVLLYPSAPLPDKPSPLNVQQINTTKNKVSSKPHVSNVTALRFFPSSRVLLTCAADFALSILSAELPDTGLGSRIYPVRVLRAHTRSVTSASIIALGRNIVSSSLDSTLRLWDVPSGAVIRAFNASAPVLCTTIGTRIPTPPDGEEVVITEGQDEREAPEVINTVTYAGLQNGAFEIFDLGTKTSVYKSPPSPSSINTLSYLPSQYLLATGAADGVVTLYDVRSLASPLTSFRRNEAGISDLDFAPSQTTQSEHYNVGLAIATADGLPYVASIIPEGPGVHAELLGVDCDPVRNIRVRTGVGGGQMQVWHASDDAVVRRYLL